MYIGNHLSSSKGFECMGQEALKLGANTFAFFTRNPIRRFCTPKGNIVAKSIDFAGRDGYTAKRND